MIKYESGWWNANFINRTSTNDRIQSTFSSTFSYWSFLKQRLSWKFFFIIVINRFWFLRSLDRLKMHQWDLILLEIICRSSRRNVCCNIGVLKNFAKFKGKHLCQSLFFNKVANLRLWKETLEQLFSYEFCEILNIFF